MSECMHLLTFIANYNNFRSNLIGDGVEANKKKIFVFFVYSKLLS
jgi:hypothetical protein